MIKTYVKFTNPTICPLCLEKHMDTVYLRNVKENLDFKISSLQISIPLKGCINDCKSCIAKISGDSDLYKDFSKTQDFEQKYLDKLKTIKEQGCKNVVLTSDKGEPIQNKQFLTKIGDYNKKLNDWFIFEIQTTGVLLNDMNLDFLKDIVGVKIISLSVFDIFDDENNLSIIDVKEKLRFNVKEICKKIKERGFILRLSINLVKTYDNHTMKELFNKIEELNPDQVTVKNLWHTDEDNAINKWIKTNKASSNTINRIINYIEENGGHKISNYKYELNNRSIWLVDNCMMGNYLILRPDAELYRTWNDISPLNLR